MSEAIVMVIDDEAGIVRLCERLLSRAGFDVLAFTDPDDGLRQFEIQQVDILLVDIRMPDRDGFEVIDLVRQIQPDLAVVIMTGFGTIEMAIQALRRGADGLILKPFAGAELVQSIRRALQDNENKRDVARLQTLRPLFNITEALFSEVDPGRVQELLLDSAMGQLGSSRMGIYFVDESETAQPHVIAWQGQSPIEELSNPEEGMIALVADLGFPLWVNRSGPGDEQLQAMLDRLDLESVLCVPVRLKEGSHVFWAARVPGQPQFTASDFEMFAILVRQASVAIENARLHAELRAYLRQVEESQRALVQAEKMVTVGRLTTSIAHEINNPLQAVQNCLHLASRQDLETETREKYINLAQSELERLMRTVRRMLEFYRPGALDRQEIDINEMIERLLTLIEPQLTERNLHTEIKLSKRLPKVLVVTDQIQQVLLNLVLNAMESMISDGTLYITSLSTKKTVDILIEDTGPGISPQDRERVFEPFVSTKDGGTGLGLAVSYGIVAAHGGMLEVVDGRGKGACFRLTLPVA